MIKVKNTNKYDRILGLGVSHSTHIIHDGKIFISHTYFGIAFKKWIRVHLGLPANCQHYALNRIIVKYLFCT